MCSISLVPKKEWGRRRCRSLNPLFKQGFAPLCLCQGYYLDYCHDYYLKVFTRDKDWLSTLFLVTSILEGKQEADCKFLNWSPPISCLRKC